MIENIEGEIWVPIFRRYEISNMGRLKSNVGKRPIIMSPTLNRGYLCTAVRVEKYKVISVAIHRLVAFVFVNNLNPLRIAVNHKNGKLDNRAESLEWVTYKENSEHAVRNGLISCREKHHKAKLDPIQVKVIRSLDGQITHQKIADYFRMSQPTISMIIKNLIWR